MKSISSSGMASWFPIERPATRRNIYIYAAAMTVDLVPAPTDEQAMLVDASVRFMESEHPLRRPCGRGADGEAYDDVAYRRTAAELGWFGLLADEAHGGGSMSGNGVLDAALIAAERGARLQPGPFVGHSVGGACALSSAGSHDDGARRPRQRAVRGRRGRASERRARARPTATAPRLDGDHRGGGRR